MISSKHIDILLSIGCNTQHDTQMCNAQKKLQEKFPDIKFTHSIMSPAYGNQDDNTMYSNMLATFRTGLLEDELKALLKEIEYILGDRPELRRQNVIMMDIDILEYNHQKRHEKDWERPYVTSLVKYIIAILLFVFLSVNSFAQQNNTQVKHRSSDTEILGKAVEYYQGGKYHEAVITFEKLQKNYNLNPRFKAYIGYSYYKEMEYIKAVQYLKEAIPELKSYSPNEQAVYIYSCAESLFILSRYDEAIEYYVMALPITQGNDKGDVYYHTAFSYYQKGIYDTALTYFSEAINCYSNDNNSLDELHKARKSQAEKMLRWLKKNTK